MSIAALISEVVADSKCSTVIGKSALPSVRCGGEIKLILLLSVSGIGDGTPDSVILVAPLYREALLHTQGTALYA